jgi:hypothetical protein
MRRHVYFYTHIDSPYPQVSTVLAGEPALWLPAPAHANGVGWQVDLHADGALPARLASRTARATVGAATRSSGRLLRSITWRAVTREQLFPVLTADLELAELGGGGCHLSLIGNYRPPLPVVGEAGDRLFGHRVAEATVRRFVLDVADRLGVAVSAP